MTEPPGPGRPLLGIALMLAAMAMVPAMDGIAKALSARYAVLAIVWARYFFHFALLAPLVVARFGARAFVPAHLGLQVVRGGLLTAATGLYFAALAHMPMADALAVFFVTPLITVLLSGLLLGETVGRRRWLAVAVGFAGACLIIRPGFGALTWPALLALASGVFYALYMIATR